MRRALFGLLAAVSLCLVAVIALHSMRGTAGAAQVSVPQQLFVTGTSTQPWSLGQYVCYRIPSLIRTKTGTFLAIVSERLGDCGDSVNTNIIIRRSSDEGATWEAAMLILTPGDENAEHENAWTLQDAVTGRIFLFSNTNARAPVDCNCEVFYITSDDDGQTWSNRTVLPKDGPVYGMSLQSGITHSSGRLVSCLRKICRNSCPADYHAKSVFSDDHGKTWQGSAWLPAGTTECQLSELSDGRLYMNMRPLAFDKGSDARLVAFSVDAGSTWGDVLPDPNLPNYGGEVAGSVVGDPVNGVTYFVHPNSLDGARSHLALRRSLDDAQTWDTVEVYAGAAAYSDSEVLDPAPGSANFVGVLFEKDDYSSVAFSTVRYSSSRKRLVNARIDKNSKWTVIV